MNLLIKSVKFQFNIEKKVKNLKPILSLRKINFDLKGHYQFDGDLYRSKSIFRNDTVGFKFLMLLVRSLLVDLFNKAFYIQLRLDHSTATITA